MHKKTVSIFISFFLFFLIISSSVHAEDNSRFTAFAKKVIRKFRNRVKSEKIKGGNEGVFLSTAQRIESPARVAILQPGRVVETLKIEPGMSILDIGAGSGLFTFYFAEALKGTGEIFATDIQPERVEYLREKAAERKYKNIFPVCVQRKGLGPFYKQHSFDIIFLCNVYYHLWHHEDYFRELRPSLKKGGRLYILQPKNDYDFTESMFGDYKQVIKVFISMGEDSPVFQRLDKKIQYFIRNWRDSDIPSEIKLGVVQDFNKMLYDRLLFNALLDYYYTKEEPWVALLKTMDPSYIHLTRWLVTELDNNGVFDRQKRGISDIDKKGLHLLNRILLTTIFLPRELPWNDQNLILEKKSVISTLKKAGFSLVREYDFLSQHYFLEFKRKN